MRTITKKGWINIGEVSHLKQIGKYPSKGYHDRVFCDKQGAQAECPSGCSTVRATLIFKVPDTGKGGR